MFFVFFQLWITPSQKFSALCYSLLLVNSGLYPSSRFFPLPRFSERDNILCIASIFPALTTSKSNRYKKIISYIRPPTASYQQSQLTLPFIIPLYGTRMFIRTPTIPAFLPLLFHIVLLPNPSLARTDLEGCTRTDVSSPAGASYAWYVPGTGELCDFLDCGGGAGAPRYDVPGCPMYTGTSSYEPSYLPGYSAVSTAAPVETGSGWSSGVAMTTSSASATGYGSGFGDEGTTSGAIDATIIVSSGSAITTLFASSTWRKPAICAFATADPSCGIDVVSTTTYSDYTVTSSVLGDADATSTERTMTLSLRKSKVPSHASTMAIDAKATATATSTATAGGAVSLEVAGCLSALVVVAMGMVALL